MHIKNFILLWILLVMLVKLTMESEPFKYQWKSPYYTFPTALQIYLVYIAIDWLCK